MTEIDNRGILEWLRDSREQGRIIADTVRTIEGTISENGFMVYNNRLNSYSDVFGIVYNRAVIDVTPSDASDKSVMSDYVSLTEVGSDLPLIVMRVIDVKFDKVGKNGDDVRYCDAFLEGRKRKARNINF